MKSLTEGSNLDHLRKQAKDLLHSYRAADREAYARLTTWLPAARGKNDSALAAMQLRLHDMQSCLAREHGFTTWNDLKDAVELRRAHGQDEHTLRNRWLGLTLGGDITGGNVRPRMALAARLLDEHPYLPGSDPWLACVVGNETAVRRAMDAHPGWVNESGGFLRIHPLIAVTHSVLLKAPKHRAGLLACLRLLLERGADPNAFYRNRWPPHSIEHPGEERLTALYGVAGKMHDAEATRLLLAAGADGNDGESLYHSVQDPDPALPCTVALLEAGTRVIGSNALARVLDFDNLAGLKLLLKYTPHGDPDLGRILHWAIYRGRSAAHIQALLDAGADAKALGSSNLHGAELAASFVLPEILRMLQTADSGEPVSEEEKFVAACMRADESAARAFYTPGIFAKLTPAQLKQLPNLAMSGRDDAVRLMVELGWPIGTRGGDIDGSALNWAVFRGQPELAEFLLERGASYREPHRYNSDVLGTLSWASANEPRSDGDWPGCAAALMRHGLPRATRMDSKAPPPLQTVRLDGRTMNFTPEVAEVLLGE